MRTQYIFGSDSLNKYEFVHSMAPAAKAKFLRLTKRVRKCEPFKYATVRIEMEETEHPNTIKFVCSNFLTDEHLISFEIKFRDKHI